MGRSPSVADRLSKLLKYNRIFQLTPASRREIGGQRDRSVANADEPAHLRPDRFEKPAHLAVAALLQRHAIPAIGTRARLFLPDRIKGGEPVFELHATAQLLEVR